MRIIPLLLMSGLVLAGCSPTEISTMPETDFPRLQKLDVAEPVANKVPFEATYHERTLSDPYHWLKARVILWLMISLSLTI